MCVGARQPTAAGNRARDCKSTISRKELREFSKEDDTLSGRVGTNEAPAAFPRPKWVPAPGEREQHHGNGKNMD